MFQKFKLQCWNAFCVYALYVKQTLCTYAEHAIIVHIGAGTQKNKFRSTGGLSWIWIDRMVEWTFGNNPR